jgi:hypothetical protein
MDASRRDAMSSIIRVCASGGDDARGLKRAEEKELKVRRLTKAELILLRRRDR